jgi:hypothetical protein
MVNREGTQMKCTLTEENEAPLREDFVLCGKHLVKLELLVTATG